MINRECETGETIKPHNLRIGVDLDDIVVDLKTQIRRTLKRGLKVDLKPEDFTEFFIETNPIVGTKHNGADFVRQMLTTSNVYELAKPLPDACVVLNKWKGQGHQIWFITGRSSDLVPVTCSWLCQHNLSWGKDRLYAKSQYPSMVDPSDRAKFKEQVARLLNLHVFIEDHPQTVIAVDSEAMIAKIVKRHGWNQTWDLGEKAVFVDTWSEIDRYIQQLSLRPDISR